MQYHQGQSTLPRLVTLLRSVGVSISKRQVQRLLTENHDDFLAEAQDVLRAGLETASFVSADDTGARHAGTNGFCTQIGNDWFTWFGTRSSKSRLNFLDLLRAGHTDYVLNDAAYDYMRRHDLPAPAIALLTAEPETRFDDRASWRTHLDRLGFNALTVHTQSGSGRLRRRFVGQRSIARVPVRHRLLSDDAGQFNVGRHALCWVHAERLVHKLNTFKDKHRAAQQRVRGLIWDFYADLKDYRLNPGKRRALTLRARFDRIFLGLTGFATLDRLLARLHANKAELLMVLERPEFRSTPTDQRTISVARSRGGRSAREPEATLAVITAMHSLASPKPATNSASASGIIWAAGSRWRARPLSNRSTITSERGFAPPDRRQE